MLFQKIFHLDLIKKLSGNRFISISNYRIKIYALNSNENYKLVLLNKYEEEIKHIYVIDEKNFIFYSSTFMGGQF